CGNDAGRKAPARGVREPSANQAIVGKRRPQPRANKRGQVHEGSRADTDQDRIQHDLLRLCPSNATMLRLQVHLRSSMNLPDIAEVSRQSGVPASTLRFYEEKGLIASVGRKGLRRQFEASVYDRLALIALGRAAGFSL